MDDVYASRREHIAGASTALRTRDPLTFVVISDNTGPLMALGERAARIGTFKPFTYPSLD